MKALRHLLLVVFLCLGQLAAAGHALEHALGDQDGVPLHACALCIATHDLGGALPSVVKLAVAAPTFAAPRPALPAGRACLPPPVAAQRGPPAA